MSITAKANKTKKFSANKIELFAIPESCFSSLLGGATAPTKAAFLSAVKTYASSASLTPDMRILLAADSDVVFEAKMKEEVAEELAMDENNTKIVYESARIDEYTLKFKAKINNPYLIELLFIGTKIITDASGNIQIDYNDPTVDNIADKGSVIIIKQVRSGEIIAGYKFIPTNGYNKSFASKAGGSETEITLKQIMGANDFKCLGNNYPNTPTDYVALPNYSTT